MVAEGRGQGGWEFRFGWVQLERPSGRRSGLSSDRISYQVARKWQERVRGREGGKEGSSGRDVSHAICELESCGRRTAKSGRDWTGERTLGCFVERERARRDAQPLNVKQDCDVWCVFAESRVLACLFRKPAPRSIA